MKFFIYLTGIEHTDDHFKEAEDIDGVYLDSSTTKLLYINDHSYYGCSFLAKIIIPSSVIKIGDHAFYCCKSLKQVKFSIPSSLKFIEYFAFQNCNSLT